ncbi:hypothetical protein [Ruania alba]|nr:hypothetical protein [Ruania alba]
MIIPRRSLALTLAAVLTLAACSGAADSPAPTSPTSETSGASAAPTTQPSARATTDVQIDHVHGLGFSPDGAILVGSHSGVYSIPADGSETTLVGGISFDAMGMTPVGDRIYASGHPGTDDHVALTAPNLGLIQFQPGSGWEAIALAGEVDFHALTASAADPDVIVGVSSGRAVVELSTDGGQTWQDIADGPAFDVVVSQDTPELILSTSENGPMVSTDQGATFAPAEGAPFLGLVEPDLSRPDGVVGVDVDGVIWSGSLTGSDDWEELGRSTGSAAAIARAPDGRLVISGDGGLQVSSDDGQTWTGIGGA